MALLSVLPAAAEYNVDAEASLLLGAGSGEFAPFYMNSNRHGKITQSKNTLIDLKLSDPLSLDRRFDWSWGVEALAGWSSNVDYDRWSTAADGMVKNPQHPARIWLQQLYAEVKWRSLFLSVGMKERNSVLVDERLSSGDLVWSGNSRSIPEVRIGFVDFQNIPLLNKALQIDVCLSYGKFVDSDWVDNHYSYERGIVCIAPLWTYKRLYFRTKPTLPFHAKFGFQMTGLFGGTTRRYYHGVMQSETENYGGAGDFLSMLLPFGHTREGYKTGDHKGSWDISLEYRFKDASTLHAYTQFFWEDGTGMSKSNGFDGLYGLEYKRAGKGWLSGVVAEYLDFTNQGGPIHWDPADDPNNSGLHNQAHGRDDYYNNSFYRSYVNYGMTIGTPMVMGTVFNTNGRSTLLYNRVRAFHIAAEGYITPELQWTAKYSHRKAWGPVNTYQLLHPGENDSWLIGAKWHMPQVPGLTLNAEVAADHGSLPASCFGVMIGATWDIDINFSRRGVKVSGK